MTLVTIAAGLGVVTLGMGTLVHIRKQRELRHTSWFQNAALKVAEHEGVRILIGKPPLEMGVVTRLRGDKYTPLVEVKPDPLYIIEVPIKGTEGKGNMRLYLNYLVPIEVVRNDINAWNVGLIEVQVGENKDKRFIVR